MLILQMLVRNKQDCMLVPFPQYPLYSAGVALAGGTVVPYFPNEDKEWAIDPQELERVVKDVGQLLLVVGLLCGWLLPGASRLQWLRCHSSRGRAAPQQRSEFQLSLLLSVRWANTLAEPEACTPEWSCVAIGKSNPLSSSPLGHTSDLRCPALTSVMVSPAMSVTAGEVRRGDAMPLPSRPFDLCHITLTQHMLCAAGQAAGACPPLPSGDHPRQPNWAGH